MIILILGVPCLMIVFLFMQSSPDVHVNMSRVS